MALRLNITAAAQKSCIHPKKCFFESNITKKFLNCFFHCIKEINICAVVKYIRNVTHRNIFFNLKKKLFSFKDNKIKYIISEVFASTVFESKKYFFKSNK